MDFFLREDHVAAYANYVSVERALQAASVRLDTHPTHLRLDVTSRCNLHCLQCVFTATRATAQDMHEDVLARVESELLPRAAAVQYADEGEPFLFRDFARLAAALARHRPAYSRIFTNATLLDEGLCRLLIGSGLADLAVSLDGATEATFARVRRTPLAPIVHNLELLRRLKAEAGARLPIVTVHVVVMLDNLHELPAIVRLGARLGVEEVVFYKLFEYTPEMVEQTPDRAPGELRRQLGEALETGARLGLRVRVAPRLPELPPPERETIDERFYAGALEVESPPARLRPGRRAAFRVRVHNRSPFTWHARPCASSASDVSVATHLYDARGALLDWDGRRTPLPQSLKPGASVEFEAHVTLPNGEGDYVLGFDLVNEGARWFGLEQRLSLTLDASSPFVALDHVPIEATPTERGRCEHPWKYASIKANGDVFPCRFLSLSMGSLRQHSFAEIWNSAHYQRLRATILDGSYAFCLGAPCPFAAAPQGLFDARIELLQAPAACAPGAPLALRLALTNVGRAAWNARPVDGLPARFALWLQLHDEQRRLQPHAPHLTPLPADVPPGARLEVEVVWHAPRTPGHYLLSVEMSRHPVFGFTTLGSPPCEVPLLVAAPALRVSAVAGG